MYSNHVHYSYDPLERDLLDFILVVSEDKSWVPEHRDEAAEQMAALKVEIASKTSMIAGWPQTPPHWRSRKSPIR
jgi:hypothetical protein